MSTYINNGKERTLDVQVTKYLNGAIQNINSYSGKNAFGSYLQITDSDLAMLSDGDYAQRLNDFCNYVEGIETTLILSRNTSGATSSNNPERVSNGMCTIGDTNSRSYNSITASITNGLTIIASGASNVTSQLTITLEYKCNNSAFGTGNVIINSGSNVSNALTPTLPSGATSIVQVVITNISPAYDSTYIYKI